MQIAEKNVWAARSRYATPVLEPTEHNLDAPARPVELLVVGDSNSVDLGGMQGVMPFAASAFRNSSLS
jgi:hypothetical protein